MSTTANHQNLTIIGLGYAIGVALAFLVLFSAILLASYICCRNRRRSSSSSSNNNNNPVNLQNPNNVESGIYLPRILFVAEDDNHDNDDVVLGLDQAVINSYPKLVFSKRGSWGSGKGSDDVVCSICLCEYRESEVLRVLPECNHAFHVMCVDAWLKLNASCPVCRSSPLPTPLSTPLQEVVPLSQYADGRRRM